MSDAPATTSERRRRLLTRAAPIGLVSLIAFAGGAVLGAGGDPTPAERFADAWERQDFDAMYAELAPAARSDFTLDEFAKAYVDAQSTATAIRVVTDEAEGLDAGNGDAVAIPTTIDTHAFGQVSGRIELPVDDEGAVRWQPHMVFPGLLEGEHLDRITRAAERASLLTRDGTPLAEGPASARTSPLGTSALAIAGSTGSPSKAQARELYAHGFPPSSLAGISGLELAFNQRLAGQPSGELFAVPADGSSAGQRLLASGDPLPGKPVRTTINPDLQEATVAALGSLYGGAVVLDARSGDILAAAGLAYSAPQPPGSTFKIITATAALEQGVVKLGDTFPIESSNSRIGREIANAHDEYCGGTLVQSFALSCNTVFAPLGVEVGAEKLVETAEKFGFNDPPVLAGGDEPLLPATSTIPDPIDGTVALGESAIGQGEVQATPLQMAAVAQAIGAGGVRAPNSLVLTKELRAEAEPVRVTSEKVAEQIRRMMIEVVNNGTGAAGGIYAAQVAGKTGTAELGPKALDPGEPQPDPEAEPELETDAWFTAFAPALDPRLAVAVMVVNSDGDGGVVAAPIAGQILSSAIG